MKKREIVTNKSLYYNTLLKVISVGFLISLVLISLIEVTIAFFSKEAITEKNVFVGNVELASTNLNNPYVFNNQIIPITSSVTNLSNTHIVLRAFVSLYWVESYPMGEVNFGLANTNWIKGEDGFYYYKQVLTPNSGQNNSADFLTSVEIIDNSNLRDNEEFVVNVYFEGAQYANDGYKNLWLTAPVEWLNIVEGE